MRTATTVEVLHASSSDALRMTGVCGWVGLGGAVECVKAKALLSHSKLGFAVEDEVGEGLEGASVFGEASAVEAGFGAYGVFEGKVARAFESAGIANQGHQCFRLDGVELFLFEDAGHHFAGFAVTVFHGVDQGQ